jgi:hypothetical protein
MQHCSANCPAMPSPQRVSATNGFRESGSVCYRMKNVGSCEGFRTPAVTNVSPRTTAGVRRTQVQ